MFLKYPIICSHIYCYSNISLTPPVAWRPCGWSTTKNRCSPACACSMSLRLGVLSTRSWRKGRLIGVFFFCRVNLLWPTQENSGGGRGVASGETRSREGGEIVRQGRVAMKRELRSGSPPWPNIWGWRLIGAIESLSHTGVSWHSGVRVVGAGRLCPAIICGERWGEDDLAQGAGTDIFLLNCTHNHLCPHILTYAHPCPPMLFKLRPCIQKFVRCVLPAYNKSWLD